MTAIVKLSMTDIIQTPFLGNSISLSKEEKHRDTEEAAINKKGGCGLLCVSVSLCFFFL
jgi:hypothetical protein